MCAERIHKLRSVAVRNAIAKPFMRMQRSPCTACDELWSYGDEKYRKSVRQGSSEKPV